MREENALCTSKEVGHHMNNTVVSSWIRRTSHPLLLVVFVLPHVLQLWVNLTDIDVEMVLGDPAKLLWLPLGYLAGIILLGVLERMYARRPIHVAWLLLPATLAVLAFVASWVGAVRVRESVLRNVPFESTNIPYPTDFSGTGYEDLCKAYTACRDSRLTADPLSCFVGQLRNLHNAGNLQVTFAPVGYLANSGGFAIAGLLLGLVVMRCVIFFMKTPPAPLPESGNVKPMSAKERVKAMPPEEVVESNMMLTSLVLFLCWLTILYPISSYFIQFRGWYHTCVDGTFVVPLLAIMASVAAELYIRSQHLPPKVRKWLALLLTSSVGAFGALAITRTPPFLAVFLAIVMVLLFMLMAHSGINLFQVLIGALKGTLRKPRK